MSDPVGGTANGRSRSGLVTPDGRYVVFNSEASNLVAGDTNNGSDVFLRDRTANTITRVSLKNSGAQSTSNASAGANAVTPDGRFVLFEGTNSDLVQGDSNGVSDLFRRDRVAGTTVRLSVTNAGSDANAGPGGYGYQGRLSNDGSLAAFVSEATNLVSADTNGAADIFVRNTSDSTTTLVSVSAAGVAANDESRGPAISADGRYVAFISRATNLVANGPPCCAFHVYLKDRATGSVQWLSSGHPVASQIGTAITPDGRFVMWTAADGAYLWDRSRGTAELVSRNSAGQPAQPVPNPRSYQSKRYQVSVSPDGRYVAWVSNDGNLGASLHCYFNALGDWTCDPEVFLRDRLTGTTYWASQGASPADYHEMSTGGTITADGLGVVFESWCNGVSGCAVGFARVWLFQHDAPGGVPIGGDVTAAEMRGGGSPSQQCGGCVIYYDGDPVSTASGNFWHTWKDFSIPGRGPALHLRHTYNSDAAGIDGPLGFGWTHSYNVSLSIQPGSVTVVEEGGSQISFTQSGGTYTPPPRVAATLVQNGDGTYTFTRRARQILKFDNTGKLMEQRDLNGYVTTITRPNASSMVVTDPAGRTLTFTLSGGRVVSVADSSSPVRTVTFAYDASGNLVDHTDVAGGNWHYTYDANHRMLTMRDPRANTVTNHYDAEGRVDWQEDHLGRRTSFDYTTFPGSTEVTDPNGHVDLHTYSNGVLVSETRGYGTPQEATWDYQYDPVTVGVTKITDPLGRVTTMAYDASGNRLTAVDPLNRQTTWTYSSLNQVTSVTDLTGAPDSGPPVVGVRQPSMLGRRTHHDEATPAHPRADRPQAP